MSIIRKLTVQLFSIVIVLLAFSNCKREHPALVSGTEIDSIVMPKIEKVTFFIENSASMFGYVNGSTNYVDVLTELADKPRFAAENTYREFNFINGGNTIEITPLGNDPSVLRNKLNRVGFDVGDVTESNLNKMFQIALNKAVGDSVSILISDGIYDLERSTDPINDIKIAGNDTRAQFIQRFNDGDVQTILIKLKSNFDGYYFYTSKSGSVELSQQRPFYIWIFGDSRLLNEYFPESYISKLSGYQAMARFLKLNKIKTPYQPIVSSKPLGRFRFDRKNENMLVDARSDQEGNFQFDIAVDFSTLPTDNDYIQLIDNYACNGNFKIINIVKPLKKVYAVSSFKPTHLITLYTDKSPIGNLEIKLKNVIPSWIATSDLNNESNIQEDLDHTYGFKFLTDAISEAYDYKNKEKNITTFNIEITN